MWYFTLMVLNTHTKNCYSNGTQKPPILRPQLNVAAEKVNTTLVSLSGRALFWVKNLKFQGLIPRTIAGVCLWSCLKMQALWVSLSPDDKQWWILVTVGSPSSWQLEACGRTPEPSWPQQGQSRKRSWPVKAPIHSSLSWFNWKNKEKRNELGGGEDTLSHWIPSTNPMKCPHFTHVETEVPRGQTTWPRAELETKAGLPGVC